eukprot:CAMPEP_0181308220 /NCGR_PEP_ID=MMETSP1101-20121128/11336_1 /TAXON_ID=46948 /ORGANISM="Rhodomonas abbreviata, Strain Caron Lab Isolate" /LENGTH=260 /DNA_ID=CAMNT_0023414567 /DNA_START=316 /DNA_END=1098 /DNA_ORIENTATION=+
MSIPTPTPKVMTSNNSSILQGFVQGAVGASMGAAASHPLDLLKVRMQIQGEAAAAATSAANAPKQGMLAISKTIVGTQGISGLYAGLSASLARQVVYSGTRFGVYDILKRSMEKQGKPGAPMTWEKKIFAALVAGGIGALVANPYDLAMVRMQADGRLPVEQRRGYKNVVDAVWKVSRSEGAGALWSGVAPNVNRAMIVTVGHLAVYDEAKVQIVNSGLLGDGVACHLTAGVFSALSASALSHPVDVAKTRLMNKQANYR